MVWPTPREHFKTLADVEFFLKHTLTEINDSLGRLENRLEGDQFEGLATSDWVLDELESRSLYMDTIRALERRIEELESITSQLEAKLNESKE